MGEAMLKEGLHLTHIIGPKTGHRYHPDAKVEINRRIDSIVAKGRDPLPKKIRFTTHTLRYNRMSWVIVDELKEHWNPARITVENNGYGIHLNTTNANPFTLTMPPGYCPLSGSP